MDFKLQDWYLEKKQGEIILDYYGNVNPDLVSEALQTIEDNLNIQSESNPRRKKVFNVFVECIQNLYHHVDEPPADSNIKDAPNFGIILLSKFNDIYRISTGNFVLKENIGIIKDRIDQLNALSGDQVRSLYRDVLNNQKMSKKGGGGLGMLDIVRKSGNKLDYYIYNIDEIHCFFSLDVYIS